MEKIKRAIDFLGIYKHMNIKPNFSKLAKQVGVNRHTLSDIYYERREFKPRNRKSQLDKHKDEIASLLKDPVVSISAAYFYLTDEERGEKAIKCTLSNFTKYVSKNKLNTKDTDFIAHFRYETEPGEQIQFDWVERMKIETIQGEIIEFNLFSATLGYSRMHYFEYTKSITENDLMRCFLHSLEYFKGKTKYALTDNMSAIVNVNEKGEKKIHPTIQQYFKDIDVELKLCKVRTPQTKGKCETSNKFAKWLYAYNGKVRDEVDLFNKIYRLNEVINKQIENQFLGRTPYALFEKEKEHLTPLNGIALEGLYATYTRTVKVPSTGLVNYKQKLYGVPQKFIGKRVNIQENGKIVEITYNSVLIATYEIVEQKVNYSKEIYKDFLKSKGFQKDLIEDYTNEMLKRFKNL